MLFASAPLVPRPSREETEAAVRTLIAFIGDDPNREGLRDTPKRVIDAFDEIYQEYRQSPAEVLDRTFTETAGYDDFVLVKDITFNSHCEHHMMPFFGKAHIAYMPFFGKVHIAYRPVDRVVGLSKLARLVDTFGLRLQTQENLTSQIAVSINRILKPRGVAVMIEAEHICMSIRGIDRLGTCGFPRTGFPRASSTASWLGREERGGERSNGVWARSRSSTRRLYRRGPLHQALAPTGSVPQESWYNEEA